MKNNAKNVLLIGINYSPEITGIGRYTGEMVEWLSNNGYQCSVITSFPYYPNWKIQKPYSGLFYRKETVNNGLINIYRCPLFVPQIPGGLKRMVHEFSFFATSFFQTTYLLFKPANQYIICIAPPFHMGFLALYYRFFKGGKIIYHIQDLQIEAAKDLKIVKSDYVFKLLFRLEAFILKKVDFVTSISTGMIEKIKNKSNRNVELFPNWVDVTHYYPMENRALLKAEWGFDAADKIVLYSGSIGEKQGLSVLVDIASHFIDNRHVKFVICGNGPYKHKLQQYAIDKGLNNIFFLPLQENKVFNKFLNFADVHLILQKGEAADLVMPSKLTTILAAGGLLIATASEGTSLYNEIVNHKMGIVVPPDNFEKLLEAINATSVNNYVIERQNARNYAEINLNKEIILNRMKSMLLS